MKKKGFTLIELLAVIVILAIVAIIATPMILNVINKAKLGAAKSSALGYLDAVEKQIAVNQVESKNEISDGVYEIAELTSKGVKVKGTTPSEGWIVIEKERVSNYSLKINGYIINYDGGKNTIDTGDKVLDKPDGSQQVVGKKFTYDGELVQGAEFVDGQYTYRYKQSGIGVTSWTNMDSDGWGVMLTDKNSTDPVTTELCSSINDKPITNMSAMFFYSKATSIDLSSFNTSKVTDMSAMFSDSQATTLDLSNFNTSNVTDMSSMFNSSAATSIDLSSFNTSKVTNMSFMFEASESTTLDLSTFNTSKVTNMSFMFNSSAATSIDLSSFDTSNVTNMENMFWGSKATSLDLSSFDTSKVTDMSHMFASSDATTGYARTQADADKFNATSDKPSTLTFVVKQ